MKHLLKPFICTTVLLAFTCQGFSQKTYTNTEWVNQTPAVGDGIYHSSSIVVANKLVVTSKVLNVRYEFSEKELFFNKNTKKENRCIQ